MVFSPYATAADFRLFYGEAEDTDRTPLIEAAIAVASEMIARECNYDLSRGSATERYWGMGANALFLKRTPIVSVASVITENGPVEVDADSISITTKNGSVFAYQKSVEVTYTAGYQPIPRDVVLATCIAAKAVINASVVDPNLTGESVAGVTNFAVDQFGAGALPRAARTLINDYVARYAATLR